jgi:hypothetical protein
MNSTNRNGPMAVAGSMGEITGMERRTAVKRKKMLK